MMMRRELSGWWLPADDTLFARYCAGPPPKRNGFYREHLQAALKFVRVWEVAIDVGAHCGFWTWDLGQQFLTVHAFEASPVNYNCLVRNVAELDNVVPYNLAVGAQPGKCVIRNDNSRPGNSGSNYVVPGSGDISMVALDGMEFAACDFLKIDVEGFELRVLEGARKLISRCRPVISLETTDYKFRGRYDIPEGAAEAWLLKRGYKMAWRERPDAVFVP